METVNLKKTARFAGLWFFVWIVTGMYGMLFVFPKIYVKGDPAITAKNLIAHEFLFRTGIVVDLIGSAAWILLALTFYQLFKQVNKHRARLLVAFVLVQIPVIFIVEAFRITALMIVKGKLLETATEGEALASILLAFNEYMTTALVLFWGLWLFPLAVLIYRSGFIPRFLGIWLFINGIVYVVLSFTGILFPHYYTTLYQIFFPVFFGELVFMLWLLIKGTKNNIQTATDHT